MRRYELTVQYPEPRNAEINLSYGAGYRVLESYVTPESEINNRVASAIAHGASLIIVKCRP